MRKLIFIIQGQLIKPDPSCDFTGIVPGTEGYLQAEFKLDNAWDGCKIAASFWRGTDEFAVPLVDGICTIPTNVLTAQYVGVSLTGISTNYRIVTNKTYFRQEV